MYQFDHMPIHNAPLDAKRALQPTAVLLIALSAVCAAEADDPASEGPSAVPAPATTQFYMPLAPGQKPPGWNDADVNTWTHRLGPEDPELTAPQRALVERVRSRWAAVVERDFKQAYEFETPDYRASHTPEEYTGQFGTLAKWHVATVKELRYHSPDRVEVVVNLDYSFNLPGVSRPVRTQLDLREFWVYLGQEWWRRHDGSRQSLGAATSTDGPSTVDR